MRLVTPVAAESKVLTHVINAHKPHGALPCSHVAHEAAPAAQITQSRLVNAAPSLNSSDSGEPLSCNTHPAR